MKIFLDSARKTTEVFQQFMHVTDDYGFSKNIVPMRLAQLGDEQLISSAQAKKSELKLLHQDFLVVLIRQLACIVRHASPLLLTTLYNRQTWHKPFKTEYRHPCHQTRTSPLPVLWPPPGLRREVRCVRRRLHPPVRPCLHARRATAIRWR